jgi:hypothetical protein
MTPEEKKRAIADALKILKPAPEQREACRQDIAHMLDQLDQAPDTTSYELMRERGASARRMDRINRLVAADDSANALPQSLVDEVVEKDKKLRTKHKTLSPDRWRKKKGVTAALFSLAYWRAMVEHSPQGDERRPRYIDLPSTKGKDWYRLSSTFYGKLSKDGKPADLRRQMRQILSQPGWVATSCVVSCGVPVRTVTVWSVSKKRLTLFIDDRKPR